ncbi:hypothetical protein ACJW30_07G110100 [Castanea mollissima]
MKMRGQPCCNSRKAINKSVSFYDPIANHRVESWTLEGEKSDCCSWDGVDCDEDTGHVMGLNLTNNCLYGSINSNSTLFHLVHLQSLKLAYNNFNYSQIPSEVGNLLKLTYLNLSSSMFSGQIPFEISKLSQLSSLDLCKYLLQFKELGLTSLVRNLTRIEYLDLSGVNIFSTVPNIFANFSTLRSLYLHDCTSFSGELPASMGNLGSLITLDMWNCNISGPIPFSLGNLTNLSYLKLSNNTLVGNIPSSIGNLVQLTFLDLYGNQLTGPILFELANMTQLTILSLGSNQLTSSIPFGLAKTPLSFLHLGFNELTDSILFHLANVPNLKLLLLQSNKFYGKILENPESNYEFPNLRVLDLSYNSFTEKILLNSFRNWNALKLDDEDHLTYIQAEISYLVGSFNAFYWYSYSMKITNKGLDMVYYKVQQSFRAIDMSSNKFVGEIPESIGDLKGLHMLNISNNILAGHIPPSIGNLTKLESLDLSQNKLSREIPHQLTQLTFLECFNVSHNNLTGSIPHGKQFDTFENSSTHLKIVRFKEI